MESICKTLERNVENQRKDLILAMKKLMLMPEAAEQMEMQPQASEGKDTWLMPVRPLVKPERQQQLPEDKTTREKDLCRTKNKVVTGVRGENILTQSRKHSANGQRNP